MAVFAIPNPKKSLQVDFPIEKVRESVKNISLLYPKYKLFSSNEIFNQYTYESYEFLSLGVYIDIHLNSINENKTEISTEIRRKMGSFNESHEVTNANNHLVKTYDCIAKLISLTSEEIDNLKNRNKTQVVINSTKKNKITATLLALFFGGFGFHKFYLGLTKLGVIYLLFCWTFIPAIIAFFEFLILAFMSESKFNMKYNNM
ncbi:TM2 domain-containing membrane protein YozV [Halpernia humi]|uniref:TM2 domain-containing membrane protein YozV n=1 Tax=Halpernia humi TaxID=493375 RepID=A0A1H5SJ28_9FLAO|nr:TM2 domain-containing protein [Halpernia humi]SEF49948.1 TM2 domain-containing membrane protein YozV [Halpernia humi]